jgi:crotonobetaine/carnitine-CoA ligase
MFPDDRSQWSLPWLAGNSLDTVPGKVFVEEVDGNHETYSDFIGRSAALARRLSDAGIRSGEIVAVLLPNGIPALHAWLAVALAGATEMPLRHGMSGELLLHPLTLAGCRTAIVDQEGLSALAAISGSLSTLENVILVGDKRKPDTGSLSIRVQDYHSIIASPEPLPQLTSMSGDIASIMLTSGTSGPSKGVLIPHAQACLIARS